MPACQFATSGSTEAMGSSQNFVLGIILEKNTTVHGVNIYFIYSMALTKSTVKYRDLGSSGTMKI